MANSADPDKLASSLIWIYTVCKSRTYPGSAGLRLTVYTEKYIKFPGCFHILYNNNGMGCIKRKKCLRTCTKCTDSDSFPACAKSHSGICSQFIHSSFQWICKQRGKTLIRQRGCTGWSGPSLSAYVWRQVFRWLGPYDLDPGNW